MSPATFAAPLACVAAQAQVPAGEPGNVAAPVRRWQVETSWVAATFALSLLFAYGPDALRMSLPWATAISAAAAGAVWLSGRRPGPALFAAAALTVALPVAGSTFEAMDLVVVLVTFRAARDSRLRPPVSAGVCLVALTVDDAWQRLAFGVSFARPSVLYPLLLTGLAVGLGLQNRRLRLQNAQLAVLRDSDRRRAVSDERRRIARDLHDVAAHHLTALVVHTKLARRVGSAQALAEAAQFTADTAAQALHALRQVVGVLHVETDSPRSPQPTLADLDAVTGTMRRAGLDVEYTTGITGPVSADIEVAAVRIAQEAMANVLRHRGPGRCWLHLIRRDGAVELTVDDDGPHTWPPSTPTGAAGHGLLGMVERARACGGRLDVGASARGGWRIHAVLPEARRG